jgi:hypothetical protein
LKITVDYYSGSELKQDALEAEFIRVYPSTTFLEVNLSDGKRVINTDSFAETVYDKNWKVWYPLHSVAKVVTE